YFLSDEKMKIISEDLEEKTVDIKKIEKIVSDALNPYHNGIFGEPYNSPNDAECMDIFNKIRALPNVVAMKPFYSISDESLEDLLSKEPNELMGIWDILFRINMLVDSDNSRDHVSKIISRGCDILKKQTQEEYGLFAQQIALNIKDTSELQEQLYLNNGLMIRQIELINGERGFLFEFFERVQNIQSEFKASEKEPFTRLVWFYRVAVSRYDLNKISRYLVWFIIYSLVIGIIAPLYLADNSCILDEVKSFSKPFNFNILLLLLSFAPHAYAINMFYQKYARKKQTKDKTN
ncbi:hypothetical protein, partial [Raoultella ornithinolytica]|uniref:hypothetical protein n=1 Tax=Raoultella ornithinolytica TaxID=54291 RepID=UPI001BD4C4FF